MNGAHPPSSIEVRTTLEAASFISAIPTGVEPVNDSFFSRRSWIMGPVTGRASEAGMTLTTPAGKPTSSHTLANARVVSGVRLAGLMMTVQPAASAGPALRVAIASGKFHGVMNSAGPTGRWRVRMRRLPSGEGV